MNKENEFLSYLQNEKRYSPNTIIAYQRDLKHFDIYLKKEVIEIILFNLLEKKAKNLGLKSL